MTLDIRFFFILFKRKIPLYKKISGQNDLFLILRFLIILHTLLDFVYDPLDFYMSDHMFVHLFSYSIIYLPHIFTHTHIIIMILIHNHTRNRRHSSYSYDLSTLATIHMIHPTGTLIASGTLFAFLLLPSLPVPCYLTLSRPRLSCRSLCLLTNNIHYLQYSFVS